MKQETEQLHFNIEGNAEVTWQSMFNYRNAVHAIISFISI